MYFDYLPIQNIVIFQLANYEEISKKWCLTTGFAYATACFHRQICLQHQRCEDEEELEVEEEEEELRDRRAMCFENF